MERYFLFISGGWRLALSIRHLRKVVESSQFGFPGRKEGCREPNHIQVGSESITLVAPHLFPRDRKHESGPEGLAVIEEKGLTAGILVDKIHGIEGGDAVRRFDLPDSLSAFCRTVRGLVEVDGGLYLLIDVGQALKESGLFVSQSGDGP